MGLQLQLVKFKMFLARIFSENRNSGLFTLKLYLLDFAVEDFSAFVALSVHDAAPTEQQNVAIKQAYRQTLHIKDICKNQTVSKVERQHNRSERSIIAHISGTKNESESSKRKRFL